MSPAISAGKVDQTERLGNSKVGRGARQEQGGVSGWRRGARRGRKRTCTSVRRQDQPLQFQHAAPAPLGLVAVAQVDLDPAGARKGGPLQALGEAEDAVEAGVGHARAGEHTFGFGHAEGRAQFLAPSLAPGIHLRGSLRGDIAIDQRIGDVGQGGGLDALPQAGLGDAGSLGELGHDGPGFPARGLQRAANGGPIHFALESVATSPLRTACRISQAVINGVAA